MLTPATGGGEMVGDRLAPVAARRLVSACSAEATRGSIEMGVAMGSASGALTGAALATAARLAEGSGPAPMPDAAAAAAATAAARSLCTMAALVGSAVLTGTTGGGTAARAAMPATGSEAPLLLLALLMLPLPLTSAWALLERERERAVEAGRGMPPPRPHMRCAALMATDSSGVLMSCQSKGEEQWAGLQ